MYGLVYALVAAAVGVGVTAVVVHRINRSRIKAEAEKLRKRGELTAHIKSMYRSGNYNSVNIGLHDQNSNETQEIKITGQEIASDLRVGDVIYLSY
ncbi:MAG: hypothetical protein AAFY76_00555 [Cyanobacteria bacterium J06649_11]|mgnify:CR=1 FL=1